MLGSRYGWHKQPGREDKLLEKVRSPRGSFPSVRADALFCSPKTFQKASVNFPWIMDFQNKSITELEVRHAILNDGLSATTQRAKVYFRGGIDSSEPGADLLHRLKDEIVACGVAPREYYDIDIFAQRVLADLKNQIELDFPSSCAFKLLCIKKIILSTYLVVLHG
jgi:hypothetical protein